MTTTSAPPKSRPQRIQLRRTKGWRKPKGAIVVSRPSKFGNPFGRGSRSHTTKETAVRLYRKWLLAQPELVAAARQELRGKDLCCWCGPGPCHADVLIAIANSPEVTP